MKKYINCIFAFLFAALLMLSSCEKIQMLSAPEIEGEDNSDNEDVTSSGIPEGILFVKNDKALESANGSIIVTDDVLEYLDNKAFAKPLSGTEFNLDVFPLWNGTEFIDDESGASIVQDLTEYSFFSQVDYIGAFGTEPDADWNIESNWWNLCAQDVEYGYDSEKVIKVEGIITEDTEWTNDNQYELLGQVFVRDGVTLTIEAGTVIFGKDAVGSEAGVLVINRGAKIIAQGTADQPIIFTSSVETGSRQRGQWGGVVICGYGESNKNTDGKGVIIEGINPIDESVDGLYGGDNNEDNSGIFQYVRIEFAGVAISAGNEINNLTLGGVGSGTTIDHVVVSYAGDDGIECFGGSVNMKYVGMFNVLDDDLDLDQGYEGKVQFVYIVRNPFYGDESSSYNFETSTSKTQGVKATSAVVANATTVGPVYQLDETDYGTYDRLIEGGYLGKEYSEVSLKNSIIIGAPTGFQNR